MQWRNTGGDVSSALEVELKKLQRSKLKMNYEFKIQAAKLTQIHTC
jgi:hypothetical protein